MLLAGGQPKLTRFLEDGEYRFFMCGTDSSLGRNPNTLLLVGYGITFRSLETHKDCFLCGRNVLHLKNSVEHGC
jgi:hypothetical protein